MVIESSRAIAEVAREIQFPRRPGPGLDLSVCTTAEPAPILAGVVQTALDTGCGPAHGHKWRERPEL